MNENQLTIVEKYEIIKPLMHNIDSIIVNCYRDRHNKYYHTVEYKCEYGIQHTIVRNNQIISLTLSDESMGLFEINKKLTNARGNGFMFNQINKLTIKCYSNLSHIKIHYYLKLQLPIMHRHFFRKLSQNPEFFQNFLQ